VNYARPVPPDQSPPSAERLRRRGNAIAAAFVVLTLVGVGVGAWLLADSQGNDREQLRDRYATGATVAASLIDSLFRVAFSSGIERAVEEFSGDVTTQQLDAYTRRNQSLYAVVLDADGSVVAASSGAPSTAGSLIEDVGDTGIAVGDVTQVGAKEAIESATRFPVGESARFLVSGSPIDTFREILSGSIAPLVRYGGEAYVLDGNGRVLGAVSEENPKRPPPPSRELVRLAGTEGDAVYEDGEERFFAGQPVQATKWHVVVTAPTADLYEPASGISRWLPWLILTVLGLALLAIGVLVRRTVEASARIAVVNAQLEASQDRLRDRAIELQASNAELQRSNAELEQFAYVASHDLSAPLRAVAGFSQLLGVRYKGKLDGDADQFIGHMQDGVERMQRIIDDLLAYSRVDRSGLQPEEIDLDGILDEVLHALGPDITERRAVVTRERLGKACGEPGQLSQVLQNLIANGMKFTADGVRPEIHVSARRSEGRVHVSVRDNGIGIDPAHVEQIFKMFQRLHSADEYEGTGIGLAISKKIVERHGGQIGIEPAPGGGTTFTFDIPAEMPA
jgi:signal transduction histidine kinase